MMTIILIVSLFVFPLSGMAQEADTAAIDTLEKSAGDNGFIDTQKLNIRLSPKGTYTSAKRSITVKKEAIARNYGRYSRNGTLYTVAKTALEDGIINGLIPFWYGTEWDFYGYTSVPKQGKIACGYFVSTVLQHGGFILNRYTLAQQGGYNEARSIQTSDSVQIYRSGFDDFVQAFKKNNEEGLYFVGLDCHVGFLLYRAGELLFIHSSYVDPLCVVIEKAAVSPTFNATSAYTVASLSTNKVLIDKWIHGTRIAIRKD
jgi:hypothetical protein